jgi:hypothetical protein
MRSYLGLDENMPTSTLALLSPFPRLSLSMPQRMLFEGEIVERVLDMLESAKTKTRQTSIRPNRGSI